MGVVIGYFPQSVVHGNGNVPLWVVVLLILGSTVVGLLISYFVRRL